ncbi:uncharacterized protein [Penaeus vannamei]|uniref:uncharacterized protein n=1 Tax=Penaeus vannamei TaxID=6689 RepID=UPI00387F5B4E
MSGFGFRDVLLVALLGLGVTGQECSWNKDTDFPEFPPIMLDASFEIVRPAMEGDLRVVRVSAGAQLTLACPGSEIANLGSVAVDVTCGGGDLLVVDGTEWRLHELGCTKKDKESIHRNLGSCGDGGAGVFEGIGFEIYGPESFYELIRVCFDPSAETTLYSEHVVRGANIAAKDIDSSRPSFKSSSGFFSVSMSTCYTQNSQSALMKTLLGDEDLANTILNPGEQLYFAKGHLAPDADFVTEAEQDATYYYINAVPQWQVFNNGNWKYLEFATRDLAEAHGTDLTIYTGGWGVLTLDDINANPVEIYLGLTENKMVVPAPAVTWKVVYEESSSRAAAVVGVNNPHITTPPTPLCSDLCSSLSWIDFDVNDLAHGYTYCCTVEDLRASVPHVPDLGNVGLLDK